MQTRKAILSLKTAADYSDKEGYGVTIAGETVTLGASATVVNRGIILDAAPSGQRITVGIIGSLKEGCHVKLGGVVSRGDMLTQKNDGTWVTDPGAGTARVQSFYANEDGVAGDLIEAFPQTPLTLA